VFSNLATRRNSAATCDPDHLRVRAPRLRCARLDVAGRRPGAAAVFVRPLAPLRRRPAPRRRPRRAQRQPRARPRGRRRVLCRHGADRREDGVHPDAVWVHGHARPPRVDRSNARRPRGRSVGGRDGRPERRCRIDGALRVLRHARDERSARLRRSLELAASPRGADRVCACRRGRFVAGGCVGAGGDCPAGDRGNSCGHDGTGGSDARAGGNRARHDRRRTRGRRSTGSGERRRGATGAAGHGRADGSVDRVAAGHGHPRGGRISHAGIRAACGCYSRARGEPGIAPSTGGGIAAASAPRNANSFDYEDERT
jgi:hypothetical protein